MKNIYTVHHSVTQEEEFKTLKALRKWLNNPANEHKLHGAKLDKRSVSKGQVGDAEPMSIHNV